MTASRSFHDAGRPGQPEHAPPPLPADVLAELFESFPTPTAICSADLSIIHCNDALLALCRANALETAAILRPHIAALMEQHTAPGDTGAPRRRAVCPLLSDAGRNTLVELCLTPVGSVSNGMFAVTATPSMLPTVACVTSVEPLARLGQRQCGARLRLLNDIGAMLSSPETSAEDLPELLKRTVELVRADVLLYTRTATIANDLSAVCTAGLPSDQTDALGRACAAWSRAENAPVLLASDVQHRSEVWLDPFKAAGLSACCCFPLRSAHLLTGVLFVGSRTRSSFDHDQVEFLQTISRFITLAHERARVGKVTADRARQFRMLLDAQRVLADGDRLAEDPLARLTEIAQSITGGVGAVVWRLCGGKFVRIAASGVMQGASDLAAAGHGSLVGLAVSQRRPLCSNDALNDTRVAHGLARAVGARSIIATPLRCGDTPLGGLVIVSDRPNAFGTDEISAAQMMAATVMAALTRLEERATRAALLCTEDMLRFTVEAALIGILRWQVGDAHVYASAEARALLALPLDGEVSMLQIVNAVHPDDRADVVRLIDTARSCHGTYQLEHRVLLADGGTRWVGARGAVRRDPDGVAIGLEGIVIDLTEQKRLQAQLVHAQKMDSVGRLAGGIAHDFNNLLSIVLGYAGMVSDGLGRDHALYRDVRCIESAAMRGAELTRQLLTFARRQAWEPRLVPMDGLVAETSVLLRPLLGEAIELRLELGTDGAAVHVDPTQIEQVLVNLAANARDAMPEGGRLAVITAVVALREPPVPFDCLFVPGPYVRLAVTDSGVGMSDEVLARVFEPFFTTKAVGRGTGLGLATCYGIVKQHGGYIWATSQPGQGTEFDVYLPCAAARAPAVAAEPMPARVARGHETLLLAEDEPMVREFTSVLLRSSGYQVLVARDGVEAMELAARHSGPIHLLVSDIAMPNMGGLELARRMVVERPDVRVLLVSGYGEDACAHGDDRGRWSVLQKPFAPESLLARVREELA